MLQNTSGSIARNLYRLLHFDPIICALEEEYILPLL